MKNSLLDDIEDLETTEAELRLRRKITWFFIIGSFLVMATYVFNICVALEFCEYSIKCFYENF